jgi:hypothetical protein
MEESIPSISMGTVGSRFVSQTDIEAAKARREEQWKAAYARSAQILPLMRSLTLTGLQNKKGSAKSRHHNLQKTRTMAGVWLK